MENLCHFLIIWKRVGATNSQWPSICKSLSVFIQLESWCVDFILLLSLCEKQDISKYLTETLNKENISVINDAEKTTYVFSEKSVELMFRRLPVYKFDHYKAGLQIDSLQLSLQSISIRFYRIIKHPSNRWWVHLILEVSTESDGLFLIHVSVNSPNCETARKPKEPIPLDIKWSKIPPILSVK